MHLFTQIWSLYNTHVLRHHSVPPWICTIMCQRKGNKKRRKKCPRAYEKYEWDRLCRSSLEMWSNCLNMSLTWWEQQEGCSADERGMWSRSAEYLHSLGWGPTTGIGRAIWSPGDQVLCLTPGPKSRPLPVSSLDYVKWIKTNFSFCSSDLFPFSSPGGWLLLFLKCWNFGFLITYLMPVTHSLVIWYTASVLVSAASCVQVSGHSVMSQMIFILITYC